MKKWYAIKHKKEKRWTAYELDKKPLIKRGYEMKGPFKSFITAMIGVNKPCNN